MIPLWQAVGTPEWNDFAPAGRHEGGGGRPIWGRLMTIASVGEGEQGGGGTFQWKQEGFLGVVDGARDSRSVAA